MSLPTMTGTARLLTDPKKALTKTNKPMATVVVKFVGWRKTADGKWEEDGGVVAAVIAFEDVARTVAQFGKGDEVDVTGRATELAVWNDKPQVKMTVTEWTAHVRSQQREAVAA